MAVTKMYQVAKRRKTLWACDVCKRRKQKCDGDYSKNTPCSNCKKLGKLCGYGNRKSPEYIELLERRVKSLEKELKLQQTQESGESATSRCQESKSNYYVKTEESSSRGSQSDLDLLLKEHFIAHLKNNVTNCCSERKQVNSNKLQKLLQKLIEDDTLMDQYVNNYLSNVHSRYPFLRRRYVETLNDERLHLLGNQQLSNTETHELVKDRFILLMVYATGASLLQSRGDDERVDEKYESNHLIFFENALLLNFANVLEFEGISNIQAILLLVVYLLRLPNNDVIWPIICTALKMCVHFGYHRRDISLLNEDPRFYILRNRTFWSAYSLERAISNSFGLPYSLNDRDIDEELPIDIDEDEADCDLIRRKFFQTYPQHSLCGYELSGDFEKPIRTSISLAVQYFHLRRLDSYIQSSLYRVDKSFQEVPRQKILKFQKQMKYWISNVPEYLTGSESDYCLYLFNKHIRSLIHPFIKHLHASDPLLLECMKSSITVCNLSKRIHRTSNRRPSSVSLQTTFLSGVTIIQGLLCNKFEWSPEINEALKSCSSVLSLLTEKLKGYNNYSTLFEKLLMRVSSGQYSTSRRIFESKDATDSTHISCMRVESGLPLPSDSIDTDLFGQQDLRRRVHERHMRENMLLFDEISNGLTSMGDPAGFLGLSRLFEISLRESADL